MKKLFIVALFSVLQALSAWGTSVTGVAKNNSGVVVPFATLQLDLTNCPVPNLLNGKGTPVLTYRIVANGVGLLSATFVTDNSLITCGGVVGHTYYNLTLRDVNSNVVWVKPYQINGAVFNLNTATVLNPIPPMYVPAYWGGILGNISDQADLIALIAAGGGGGGTVDVNGNPITGLNLNSSSPLPDPGYLACLFKVTSPNAILECPGGTTGATFAFGNDSRIIGAEQTSHKDATNGYAGLDSSGKLKLSEAPMWNQSTTGNAGTATASDHTPTRCPTGQAPTGVDSSWNSTGCQVLAAGGGVNKVENDTNIAFSASTSDVVVNIDLPTANTGYVGYFTIAQTVADAGCSVHGAIAVQLNWTDAFSNQAIASCNNIGFRAANSTTWTTPASASTVSTSTISPSTVYYGLNGLPLYDAANQQLSYTIHVVTQAAGCSVYPQFQVHAKFIK